METQWYEYGIAILAVAAFGYFIYTRIKAAKERRANRPPGSGGGGGGGTGPGQTHPK